MRNEARNYGDERTAYLELLGEKIRWLREDLACALAEWEKVAAARVDFDPDPATRERPGIDMSLFDSAGTDVREQYRPVEDVPIGGML